MAINPNILLTGRGPEVVDPMETAARGMSLANVARAAKLDDLKLKEIERQRAADEQIRGIFSQGITDPNELVQRVYAVDPAKGQALGTHFADLAKKRADALKVTTDVDKTRDELLNSKWQAVGNRAAALLSTPAEARAALYGQMRGELLQGGQFKPEELPDAVPDDLTLKYLSGATLTPKEQEELRLKVEQEKRAAEADKRDAAKDAAQLPGMTADARAKELAAAGQSVAAVADQSSYDAWLATQPESVRTYWGQGFSPEKVKQIQRVGMTAAERSTADDRVANREFQATQNDKDRAVQVRGQNLVDRRAHQGMQIQGFQAEGKLRDDYGKESKTFVAVRDAVQKIEQAATGKTGASDIALVYGFMRALDPGSTVREGEYATAENSGGVADKWRNWHNRVINGERLPENVRSQMVAEARKTFQQAQGNQAKIDSYYTGLTQRYKLNPQNVLTDYRTTENPGPVGGQVMSMADVQATAKASGKSVQQVIEAAKAKGFEVR